MNRIQVILLCVLSWLGRGGGVTKRYVASWDFSNEDNWQSGNAPCAGSRVRFRSRLEFPAFVDKETTLKSIDFHSDVTLIFGNESSLVFEPDSDSSCQGTNLESVFEKKIKGYWWDPDSWECEQRKAYECNSAVPDIHRVPCLQDSVLIPNVNKSLFRILFTDPVPTVKSLQLGEERVSTSKFFEFASSEEGRQRVIKRYSERHMAPLYVEEESSCTEVGACPCHPTSPVNEICRHMKWKCPEITCNTPVYMQGFCCKMCGAEIAIAHKDSLSVRSVRNLLERVLKSEQGAYVDGYTAKMPDDLIHVYFFPQEKWGDYKKALFLFAELFQRDLNANGVYVTQVNAAQGSIAEKLESERKASNSRTLAIIFTLLFITLGISFTVYLYRKRRVNELPFMFRRLSQRYMSTRSSRSTSIPTLPSTLQVSAVHTSEGISFTNPSFKETTDSHASLSRQTTLTSIPEVECPTQRENPLYNVQMEQGISFRDLADDTVHEIKEEDLFSGTKDDVDQVKSEEVLSEPLITISDTVISVEDDAAVKGTEEAEENGEEDPLDLLAKSRIEKANKTETEEGKEDEIRENVFDELEKEDFGLETLIPEDHEK